MTGPLGPPKIDWGRDIGVPRKEHPKVQATESLREAEESSPRAAREGSRSRPPPTRWRSGVGFPSVAVGGRLEAGAGPGAGASWGLWAAGVAWDTQERRPPRREQRRSPDGAPLHGAGSLRAVATRQPPTSPGARRPRSLLQPRGAQRRRRPLVPGTGSSGRQPWSGAAAAITSCCWCRCCWG